MNTERRHWLANPFRSTGTWYKGNLHCHSTQSDGQMPPANMARHYHDGGYDFIALTDHSVLNTDPLVVRNGFLVIPGVELSTKSTSDRPQPRMHVVALGIGAPVEETAGIGPQELIDAIRSQDGVAVVAHPSWSGLGLAELRDLRGHLAIEVFNAHVEVSLGRGLSSVQWDDLLTRGHAVFGLAVDDAHQPAFDSLRAWTMVRAEELTAPALLTALRAGHFYCSNGPEILDVRVEPDVAAGTITDAPLSGTITVRCTPVRAITLVADAPRGARVNAGTFGYHRGGRALRSSEATVAAGIERTGDFITGAEFPLGVGWAGPERYARIEIEDHQGRKAWTNPLFITPSEEAAVG